MEKFPAYKYEDFDTAPVEVWTAFRLLQIAESTNAGRR